MILKELISKHVGSEIALKDAFRSLFVSRYDGCDLLKADEDEIQGCIESDMSAFKEIQNVIPNTSQKPLTLIVSYPSDVYGVDPYHPELKMALDYVKWSSFLAYNISESNIEEIGELNYLVAIIDEMTWSGFTEEQVNKTVEDFNNMLEKEAENIRDRDLCKSEFKDI